MVTVLIVVWTFVFAAETVVVPQFMLAALLIGVSGIIGIICWTGTRTQEPLAAWIGIACVPSGI